MLRMRKLPIIAVATLTVAMSFLTSFSACNNHKGDELTAAVDSFATSYFNWHFPSAASFATRASRQWLSYAASQVRQEDIDSLRTMKTGATVAIVELSESDTGAIAVVAVKNHLALDSIGGTPRISAEDKFELKLVTEDSQWKVDLKELPKPVKK